MSFTPITNFKATPDFSIFQFRTETTNGFIDQRVRFSGLKGGRVYQVEYRNLEGGKRDDPAWPQSDEFLDVVVTLVLIIEIYTERFPMRILRFSPDNQIKADLFGKIKGRFKYLLENLFELDWEKKENDEICQDPDCRPFLIKRKPISFISAHTLETNLRGVSRIFNNPFKIELEKSIRLGLTMPKA